MQALETPCAVHAMARESTALKAQCLALSLHQALSRTTTGTVQSHADAIISTKEEKTFALLVQKANSVLKVQQAAHHVKQAKFSTPER